MNDNPTDKKNVCDSCHEKKVTNNNNYTFFDFRRQQNEPGGRWVNGILCKSCYTVLKSGNYIKEIHTIYPQKMAWGWDWTDSVPDTKDLLPRDMRMPLKSTMVGVWDYLISALLQTHSSLTREEERNLRRFKLMFSSHPFPNYQVMLQFAKAERNLNWYRIAEPKSLTARIFVVDGKIQDPQNIKFKPIDQEVGLLFLNHRTAIFWFNTSPKFIYLKADLLEDRNFVY